MITEVVIKNFKCFKNLIIPELGQITLISGRNNVGKTALLEALFLFFDRQRADMILRQYGWRGIEGVTPEPHSMWSPIFHNYDMDQEIVISATLDRKTENAKFTFNRDFVPPDVTPSPPPGDHQISTDEEPSTTFSLDIEYTNMQAHKIGISHLSIDHKSKPCLYIEKYETFRKPPAAAFLASKKHIPSRETTNRFSNFVKEGREHEITEFLRIIEPRLDSLTIVTEGPASFVHGKLRGISRTQEIHLMGEGMEKLLNLILHVASSQGGCVFLDEIENGFHHTGLPKIWEAIGKTLRKYNCQLITTTHSYECVQAAHEGLSEMPEAFRHIRLDRKGEEISAKLSNYDMIGAAIKTNLEIR